MIHHHLRIPVTKFESGINLTVPVIFSPCLSFLFESVLHAKTILPCLGLPPSPPSPPKLTTLLSEKEPKPEAPRRALASVGTRFYVVLKEDIFSDLPGISSPKRRAKDSASLGWPGNTFFHFQ